MRTGFTLSTVRVVALSTSMRVTKEATTIITTTIVRSAPTHRTSPNSPFSHVVVTIVQTAILFKLIMAQTI